MLEATLAVPLCNGKNYLCVVINIMLANFVNLSLFIRPIAVFVFLAACFVPGPPAKAANAAVILSADVDPFHEAVRGFKAATGHRVVAQFDMAGDFDRGREILEDIETEVRPDLIYAVGPVIFRYGATLEHFAGDGIVAFLNDPVPCPNAPAQGTEMAVAMKSAVGKKIERWQKRGFEMGFGIGIALGYATLGQIGFKGGFHYGAIGTVLNLASRLCDKAESGQILVTQRVFGEIEDLAEVEPIGELELKGFLKPVSAMNVVSLKSNSVCHPHQDGLTTQPH